MNTTRTISPATARRLAIAKQHLAKEQIEPTAFGIFDVVRDIGCLQLDPISVVSRSHTLVVMSRVGAYDPAQLDKLIYQDRMLFEYWAHAASLVLTEDYPIHHWLMRTYAKTDSPWHRRIAEWIEANKKLRDYILREIKRNGPVPSRVLTEAGVQPKSWVSSGWTNDRNVSRMLDFLWIQGKILVAKRQGLNKYWDLAERVLPDWTPRHVWSEREVVKRAAQKSLRALGVGTEMQISRHYISGRYPKLKERLNELEQEGVIERVTIQDKQSKWGGTWYVHSADIPQLESIERGDFEGRTVLLSPFDNLIRDRVRTMQFWNFDYKIEIYTPRAKRKYGYYVLPILHGDQLIGRIDPAMNRANGTLEINAVHAEPNAPRDAKTAGAVRDAKTGRAVRDAIEELGEFLGASKINFTKQVPEAWRKALR
ncbi:MAG TPA: crosslink repair DNA glycosylase YcaQ family protein [Anaerolineae bacterium]|nr:crosslink repair DNA glycosylase YcaQ family protein [Anaerolineae bacterium]